MCGEQGINGYNTPRPFPLLANISRGNCVISQPPGLRQFLKLVWFLSVSTLVQNLSRRWLQNSCVFGKEANRKTVKVMLRDEFCEWKEALGCALKLLYEERWSSLSRVQAKHLHVSPN